MKSSFRDLASQQIKALSIKRRVITTAEVYFGTHRTIQAPIAMIPKTIDWAKSNFGGQGLLLPWCFERYFNYRPRVMPAARAKTAIITGLCFFLSRSTSLSCIFRSGKIKFNGVVILIGVDKF
jgi:hypothetical protein